MNIQEKIKIFEESCRKLLNQDVIRINQNIDTDIEQQIKDELTEYQEKEELAYQKKVEKLEKDFNKQIYSLEMQHKKEVSEQKKQIQKELRKEMIQILQDFTQKPDYEIFLLKRVEEVIQKVGEASHSILRLTAKDKERFGEKIQNQYGVQLQTMEDKYIGGCILEDRIQGLYLDDTMENSINEKLEIN